MLVRVSALIFAAGLVPTALAAADADPAPGGTAAQPTAQYEEYNTLQDEFAAYQDLRTDDYNAHRYNLIVDALERPEEWRGEMGRSEGVITLKRIYGAATQLMNGTSYIGTPSNSLGDLVRPSYRGADGQYESRYFEDLNYPAGTPPQMTEQGYELRNQRLLGVRVDFFHRGISSFAILPANPIWFDGEVKGIETYVLGRNARHTLYVMLRDINGNDVKLRLGTLDFQGWAQLSVPIPPQVRQAVHVGGTRRGLEFRGFWVETDIDATTGSYYMYFDNISVLIDRFWEETQDPADPLDVW